MATVTQPIQFVWDRREFLAHMASRSSFQAFFESFSPMDLSVRRPSGVYSADTYLAALVPKSAVPSDLIAGAIQRDVHAAEMRLRRLASSSARARDALRSMVDAARKDNVPWVLAFIEDRAEGGMPHTHGGVISLPFKWALRGLGSPGFVQTLIHERVHILQRRYPALAQKLAFQSLGVRPTMLRSDLEPFLKAQWRTNPDLDPYVYSDGVLALFNENATTLGDIRLVRLFQRGLPSMMNLRIRKAESEHPFETIAYKVAAEAAGKA